ncbi:hypothetical protein ACIRCZ_19535 [Leifsonia sp. NPDC102414]|uniref:hypothetical protein n=1 Tax=Leifsonia sp. NPDC102414 TaxID=3364124 RepID=UPI0038103FFD
MTRYTPTEILTAGANDTRETFAHLYVVLDQLRAAAAYNYHLAFVDEEAAAGDGRLPFHPAPAGFGGNELAVPARPIRLDRLTDAGLALYAHGIQAALAEQEQLLKQIDQARYDLERMHIAMTGTNSTTVDVAIRAIDINAARANSTRDTVELAAWDVPVRIPGGDTVLNPPEVPLAPG